MLRADGCRISATNPSGAGAGYGFGLYLDPIAYRDKKTGALNTCAFHTTNAYVVIAGAALADTFGRIEAVTFNADGEAIQLEMIGQPEVFKSLGGGSIRHDDALGLIPADKMRKVIAAKSLAVRISGSHQSRTLEPSAIDPAWRDKMRRFQAEAMK